MSAHPLRWIFNAIVKPMALADLLSTKTTKLLLVSVCFVLLLFIMSSSVFNAYAQQGKSISGGAGFGGPAIGGQATGGAAINNGMNVTSPDIFRSFKRLCCFF